MAATAKRWHSVAALIALFFGLSGVPGAGQTTERAWPRVYIRDAFVRDAVVGALDAASERLHSDKCQLLLSEFLDQRGRPLSENLEALDLTATAYLRVLVFMDGETYRPCNEQGVLAFTVTGSRIVYLCGPAFQRAWKRDGSEVRATIIHELLHTLGLGENPPSPRQITYRVNQLCW